MGDNIFVYICIVGVWIDKLGKEAPQTGLNLAL